MPAASPWPDRSAVAVWHDTVEAWRSDTDRLNRGLAWLSPPERLRYARFVHDDDRWMFLMGRVMARTLVGRALGCDPTAWRWREGPHGRPEIDEPGTAWRFNVAHSAGLVACAIAEGRDVGVDVEDLARRPVSPGFLRRYFSPGEVADVGAQPAAGRQERLLTYWTLKEAYLKARGLGVSVPLADVEFALTAGGPRIRFLGVLAGADTNWHFHLERTTPRHLMAVASHGTSAVVTGLVFSQHFGTDLPLNAPGR
jgi:4'-phosphopantetheinyl transferase